MEEDYVDTILKWASYLMQAVIAVIMVVVGGMVLYHVAGNIVEAYIEIMGAVGEETGETGIVVCTVLIVMGATGIAALFKS